MKKYNIKVNGASYEVEVEEIPAGVQAAAPATPAVHAAALVPAASTAAPVQAASAAASVPAASAAAPVQAAPAAAPAPVPQAAAPSAAAAGGTQIKAPMPGTIIKILVGAGDAVKRSQPIVLLEAMKMENEIVSPVEGTILAVHTSQGASVNTGDLLLSIG